MENSLYEGEFLHFWGIFLIKISLDTIDFHAHHPLMTLLVRNEILHAPYMGGKAAKRLKTTGLDSLASSRRDNAQFIFMYKLLSGELDSSERIGNEVNINLSSRRFRNYRQVSKN